MNKEEYKKLVKKYTPEENKIKNMLLAFVSGGTIGVISNIIYEIGIHNNIAPQESSTITIIILIVVASFLTGLGIFDKLVEKFKCGIIIPITGFAHSMTSATVDTRKDGLITGIGSSVFKLAGSVLLYGVFSAFILTLIKEVLL